MNDLTQTLKTGTLLILETGEYSDRSWEGPFRVKRDFVKGEVAEVYRTTWKKVDTWRDKPSGDEFIPWLVKEGYIEDAGMSHTWHVGSYGSFDP